MHAAKKENGVVMVEFALVLPLFAFLIIGTMWFGLALNYWIDETHLANEAARFAAVGRNPGNDSGGMTLQEWTRDQAVTGELKDGDGELQDAGMTVCLEFPNGAQVGEPVKATASTTFNFIPFLPDGSSLAAVDIAGASTMRLEAREDQFEAGIAAGCAP